MEAMMMVSPEGLRMVLVPEGVPMDEGAAEVVLLSDGADREPDRRPAEPWRRWGRRQLVGATVETVRRLREMGLSPLMVQAALEPLAQAGDHLFDERPRGRLAQPVRAR